MNKAKRLGEVNISNEKYKMLIIEYNNANDLIIEFQDEHKARICTTYQNFKKGSIGNPFHPSIYGIGYIGQGKHKTFVNGKDTDSYQVWHSMLRRCYDPYYLNKEPTYINCYVCEEWLNYQNFAKWYEENYYNCNNEEMHLDKDILIKGNKIYSPENCIFVPKRINILFVRSNRSETGYPIGVSCYKKDKLRVQCNYYGKRKFLGYFPLDRPFQAFTTYRNFKEKYIKQVADEYKDLIPIELYNAMYNYKVEIND